MTGDQERAKELLPIIQAIAEGKKIQYSFNGHTWFDKDEYLELNVICNDIISDSADYRIKPEENYTIEQNCGENRVEGEVLSVSGSVSEKHTCKECVGESVFKGKKAYCKNRNCDLPACDNFKSKKEKHYRPFEDSAELMVHYSKHFNIDFPPFYEPIIWVKRKDNDSRFLITGYDELDVFLEDCYQDLNDLYEQYVFLDGSCIGKEK